MKPISIGRHCLVISTSILLLVAIAFSIAAIATPSWQTVYLAEFQSEHEHGLWMDCTITRRYSQGFINYHQHCTYKFENAYFPDGGGVHQEEEQHKFHEWHKAVLLLFGVAILAAVTSLCFSFCALCIRICAIVANVLSLIAAMSATFGLAVFFISSHRNDIRFVQGITRTYEQSKGYSFYLGVGAMLTYITAFIVSILATVFVFLHDRQQHSPPNKTYPKDRNENQRPQMEPTSIAV